MYLFCLSQVGGDYNNSGDQILFIVKVRNFVRKYRFSPTYTMKSNLLVLSIAYVS